MSDVAIRVNDSERTYPAGACVRDVVADITGRAIADDGCPTDGDGLGVAVAVDGTVVPRSTWARTEVRDGARVELVSAVQGG